MPTFTMLIGLPGAGKTDLAKTIIESNKENTVLVSASEVRNFVFSYNLEYNLYGQDRPIFTICNEKSIANLNVGNNVIYDATNLTHSARMKTLNHIKKAITKDSVVFECIVVVRDISNCIDNCCLKNENIIKKCVKKFQIPFYEEGWDAIRSVHSDGKILSSVISTENLLNASNEKIYEEMCKQFKDASDIIDLVENNDYYKHINELNDNLLSVLFLLTYVNQAKNFKNDPEKYVKMFGKDNYEKLLKFYEKKE